MKVARDTTSRNLFLTGDVTSRFMLEPKVVYHLQQLSGNSGWKVNGTRLFGLFQWISSGSNGTSERVVLFFQMECSKRKFVYHLFKTNL